MEADLLGKRRKMSDISLWPSLVPCRRMVCGQCGATVVAKESLAQSVHTTEADKELVHTMAALEATEAGIFPIDSRGHVQGTAENLG